MSVNWEERRDNNVTNTGRDAYERDYARVVHSAAFRRLQSKTQVLGIGDGDFYRTRLTHSIEVSQIGEAIAHRLKNGMAKIESDDIRRSLFVIRTICLAHDLGHPPFGHGGEVALNRCMLKYGGFESNGQALRIMTRLGEYHEKHGMNLSRRSLLGVMKYPAPYSQVVAWEKYECAENSGKSIFKAKLFKPPKCYLDTEADVVSWVVWNLNDWPRVSRDFQCGVSGEHHKTKHKSFDASILEIADDIAYGVHDLEDAIKLKLIGQSAFVDRVSAVDLEQFCGWSNGINYEKLVKMLFSEHSYKRKKAIGRLINFCIHYTKLDDSNQHGFSHPIFIYQAILKDEARTILDKLQKLVKNIVISSINVQRLEFKGQKIITELFDAFATDPKRLLPSEHANHWDEAKVNMNNEHRVICDYIAGMTDEYAVKRYEQLFAPREGSVFDMF